MTLEILAGEVAAADNLADAPPVDAPPRGKRLTRRALIFRRFLRNRSAVVGLGIFVTLGLLAIVGPMLIASWSYTEIDNGYYLKSPSARHWFGTTQTGRDVFAMTLEGLRKSMIIGVVTGLLSTGIAAIIGSFAAYFGGWFERISMWVVDMMLVLPAFLVLAIVTQAVGPGKNAVVILILLLALFGWMLSARVVRSLTMSVRERDYVTAAKYMGVTGPTIVFRHILPNIASLLIIDSTLAMAGAVLTETTLSFFGFGIQPPDTSLGTLIADGQGMATTFPWVFLASAGFLVVMITSLNLMGDGLRDAFDPTSKSGGHG